MTAKHADNVLRVPISEIGNNNKSSSEDFSSFNKKYTKYIPYIPWPTPCEVAIKMQTMVSCEHLAAASRGWSALDWAEHCLKLVLFRLRSGLPTHLCNPSFKGQGAFSTQ